MIQKRRKKSTTRKKTIINYLLQNCEEWLQRDFADEKSHIVNEKNWTPADLFIRQYLNNTCDGFGLNNVCAQTCPMFYR